MNDRIRHTSDATTGATTDTTAATFAAFEADARARGFDEVLARDWPASAVIATHSHAFTANALVVAGEMWLTQYSVGDA